MPSIGDLKTLREAYSAYSDLSLADALSQIGEPCDEAIVTFALAQMSHADRNIRVLALRALEHHSGESAADGVLAGLRDEKRRVCIVAIQACRNFMDHDEIVARLETIVRDARQKRKLRRRALSMLAGNEGRHQGDLSEAAEMALRRLMNDQAYRFAIVFGLARLDLGARVTAILQEFAASSDVGERQMAARALDGERVIHIDGYSRDEAMKRRIMESCDIAHGRMYYWLARTGEPHPPATCRSAVSTRAQRAREGELTTAGSK